MFVEGKVDCLLPDGTNGLVVNVVGYKVETVSTIMRCRYNDRGELW